MRPFTLLEPRNLDGACIMLSEHESARPVAGGTALIILIKQGFFPPEVLVNLMKIEGAAHVEVNDGWMKIGALATMNDIDVNPLVRKHLPALSLACHEVANIRIRNVATLGGNIAHADYQEDPPTVLLALDATIELRSVRGVRYVPLDEFLQGVYATDLASDELVVAVKVPLVTDASAWTYVKFKTRSSEDRPTAGVAVGLTTEEGICTGLRLAVGAATSRPVRIHEAEKAAIGQPVGPKLFEEVAVTASTEIQPVEDLNGSAEYKRHVVRAIVRRALEDCSGGGESV